MKIRESGHSCVLGSNYVQYSQKASNMCKVSKLMHLRKQVKINRPFKVRNSWKV